MFHCLACHFFSADPFLVILVPLERGGLCGHFKSNYIKIGPRSSEISSVKHWNVEICSVFTLESHCNQLQWDSQVNAEQISMSQCLIEDISELCGPIVV